jgi:hypothetical protein
MFTTLRAIERPLRREIARLDDLPSVSDCAGRCTERDPPSSSPRSAGLEKLKREGYHRLTY